MKHSDVYGIVAERLNIPEEVVSCAYKSYWKFIRDTIEALPLKENLSEEEFRRLKTNFNLPSLGKLNCTYERFVGMKKKLEYIKNLKQRYAEHQEDTTLI